MILKFDHRHEWMAQAKSSQAKPSHLIVNGFRIIVHTSPVWIYRTRIYVWFDVYMHVYDERKQKKRQKKL